MALLALSPNLGGYIVAMVVFGIGSGLLDVAPAAVVGDVAGKRGGTVVAGFQMAGDGGSVSGPIVAGWVADTWSYGAAFWLTTGILAGAGALAARAPDIRVASASADAQATAALATAEIQADLTAEKA
jgi:MFS family permease